MSIFCNSNSFSMKSLAALLLIIAVCSGCSSKDKQVETTPVNETDLLSLVSVQMPGWEENETTLISKASDISKHMGNEAELYLTYGLKRLATKKYKNGKSLPMLVTVYEFNSSEDAYGIYSFDTVGDKLDIGQEAVYGHGVLRFWKDNMLVRVLAEEEYTQVEKDILSFGRQIDSRILTTGPKSQLLSLIPQEKLIPDTTHFFHSNLCLNNIYYMPESSTLDLSGDTNVLTARYNLGGEQPPLLILIEYPNGVTAEKAFAEFSNLYFRGEPVDPVIRINIIQMEDETYSSITLNRKYVILVFEARHADICKKLVAATLASIELYNK